MTHQQSFLQQTNTKLTYLRQQVAKGIDGQQILACIDSIQAKMPSQVKQQATIDQELKELKRNNSSLTKKVRQISNKLTQEQQQNRVLQQTLDTNTRVHKNQVDKLLKWQMREQERQGPRQEQTQGTQCELLSQDIIKELNSQNAELYDRISVLQRIRQQLTNENSSKKLLINSLYTALERVQQEQKEAQTQETSLERTKSLDNSTVDYQSDKRSLFSLSSFRNLQRVEEEIQEDDYCSDVEEEEEEQEDEQEEGETWEGEEGKKQSGWLGLVRQKSWQLYRAMFGA